MVKIVQFLPWKFDIQLPWLRFGCCSKVKQLKLNNKVNPINENTVNLTLSMFVTVDICLLTQCQVQSTGKLKGYPYVSYHIQFILQGNNLILNHINCHLAIINIHSQLKHELNILTVCIR